MKLSLYENCYRHHNVNVKNQIGMDILLWWLPSNMHNLQILSYNIIHNTHSM